jgi:hypothetical protein
MDFLRVEIFEIELKVERSRMRIFEELASFNKNYALKSKQGYG